MLKKTGRNLFILLLSFNGYSLAELTATVDKTIISDIDLLTLTVRATAESFDEEIKFPRIEDNFEIVNQSSRENRSISIINGETTNVSYKDHVFTLRPKKTGDLTIPSIIAGMKKTRAIRIRVSEKTNAQRQMMKEFVFFETNVNKDLVYVQEQILYTVKLFYRDSIRGDFPQAPNLPNTVIENIEEEKRYESIINGRRYYVLEKTYALFPQNSGDLTIPSESFVGSYGLGGVFSNRQRISATSKKHQIKVKPVPASFEGKHWIPAEKLTIKEYWDEDAKKMRVGEPANRKIEIFIKGLDQSMLPDHSEERIEGFKLYADPPLINQTISPDGLSIVSTTTIAMIPTVSGNLKVPAIKIPWWNVKTNQQEMAIIPEQFFDVTALEKTATIYQPPVSDVSKTEIKETIIDNFWFWTSMSLLMVWLTTVWRWLSTYRTLRSIKTLNPTRSGDKMTTNTASDIEDIFLALQKACDKNDASEAHKQITLWRSKLFPKAGSLFELLMDFPDLSKEFLALENFLYGKDRLTQWEGDKLSEELLIFRKNFSKKNNQRKTLESSLNPI